ncbi:Uncharacterised protein [Legionella beliardensis]|uniref:Uncharacterized protein n=1 Tax=Legionella beliardensis TaxID=91822 RepID=A0A378I586_9GAMM|nr:hypothetical protein [Legionella beliardensis]STX29910.1 Uncharacterised protein [Legionella beliardensis]
MAGVNLEDLNIVELEILLGHLRLGEAHLKKNLNKRQFKNLIQLGSLNITQHTNIQSNGKEKSGNVALVLNCIITSTFGAWMGFSAFMGLHLDSFIMLAGITLIALLTSSLVGYFSFKLTALNAQAAINKQKILNVQLHVTRLIFNRKQEQIESLTKYLNHSINYLFKNTPSVGRKLAVENCEFNENSDFISWINDLCFVIKKKCDEVKSEKIYEFYGDRLNEILNSVQGLLTTHWITDSEGDISVVELMEKKGWNLALPDDSSSFIQVLSNPVNKRDLFIKQKSWVRKNLLTLIAGVIPTFLGGFASMFVFLAGGPNLARELGLDSLAQALRNPSARLVEFSIAVSLTIYYAISYAYNNYKLFLRDDEAEKTKKEIVKEEQATIDITTKLNVLEKMKEQMMRIINIYTALEKIANIWVVKKRELNNYMELIKIQKIKEESKLAEREKATY